MDLKTGKEVGSKKRDKLVFKRKTFSLTKAAGQSNLIEKQQLVSFLCSGNVEVDGDVDSGVGSLAATQSSGTNRQPENFQDNNDQVEADQPARATSSMLGYCPIQKFDQKGQNITQVHQGC